MTNHHYHTHISLNEIILTYVMGSLKQLQYLHHITIISHGLCMCACVHVP